MKKYAVTAAALVAAVTLAGAPAHAVTTTTKQVRQSDFVSALSDTRATGHLAFLNQGIHVWTEGSTSTDKVAEYFATSGPLPSTSGIQWFGTQPQPGIQIVFDADSVTGNGNDYNVLVGEPVYGTDSSGNPTDWWLTNGSSAAAKTAAPSTTGGSGNTWHGTLAQWKTALPTSRFLAGGFSLGSGVKGDGVIGSISYDSTTYEYTNLPAITTVDVTGDVAGKVKRTKAKVTLTSHALPANSVQGTSLAWKVQVDGKTVETLSQGAGESSTVKYKFARNSGTHRVVVLKNGLKVATYKVKTNG